ncbi:MAG: YdcF family protein [Proteobacteria bacterium]|nr:YdcF family protein [Pseudomonadota bacterium]
MFKILKPSLLILAAVVAGGAAFRLSTPNTCAQLSADDEIFVLTGDVRRIPFAVKLLDGFPGRRLFIVGAGARTVSGLVPANLMPRIELESESKNTYENALAVREIVLARGFRRIAIITTEDHMNRAMLLVSRELPDTVILACPVALRNMPKGDRIARWTFEYFKYIGTLAGFKRRG